MSEADILAAMAAILGGPPAPAGIGDDAAVLPRFHGAPVISVDAAIEGVHFTRALLSLEDVGYRATMAAASDLAAMGATARAIVAAVTAPRGTALCDFEAIARGQRAASDELQAPVVGGNLARADVITVTTTVLGEVDTPLLRSGARVGDLVGVFGRLGLAHAGLRLLLARGDGATAARAENYPDTYSCLTAFRRPRALLEAGRALVGCATAALDVSDGLAIDAARLARQSDVRLELLAGPIADAGGPALRAAARALDTTALDLALRGGEDYALLFTAPTLPPGATLLGRVIAGPAELVVRGEDGLLVELPTGFSHFP